MKAERGFLHGPLKSLLAKSIVFVWPAVLGCFTLAPSALLSQQPLNATETQCMTMVRGKVAWNKQGNMKWNDANVTNLCRGTTNPAATISCFQAAIQANQTWDKAITQCNATNQALITVPKAPTTRSGASSTNQAVAKVDVPPPNNQYGAPPAAGYGVAPPAKGQYTAPPANGYGSAPPAKGQYTAPPANGYGAAPPQANQYHAPPSAAGNQYGAPPNTSVKSGVGGGEGNYGNVAVKPPDQYNKVGVGGGEGNYGSLKVSPPANQYHAPPSAAGNQYGAPPNASVKSGVGGGEGNYGNVAVKPPDQYNKVGIGSEEGNYGSLKVSPPANQYHAPPSAAGNQYGAPPNTSVKSGVGGGEGNYGNVAVKPPDQYNKVGVGSEEGNYGSLKVSPPANQYHAPPSAAGNQYGAPPNTSVKSGVGGGEGNYGNVAVKPPDQYNKVGIGSEEGNYGSLKVSPPANQYHAPPSAAGKYDAPPNSSLKAGVGGSEGNYGEVAIKPKVSTAPSEGVHIAGGVAASGAAGLVTGAGLTAITEAASGQKVTIQDPTKLKFVGATNQPKDLCWRDSYPNGAGKTMGCSAGLEKSGQLCYPPTRAGYSCAGTVCLGSCPAGFADVGALCQKPASYGRGAGYAIWSKDKCNSENPQGCEENGAMYYPRCKANFHAVGCCTCSPDCPAGMTDTGVGCTKTNYTRGVGSPITSCAGGLQQNGLLCYTPCRTNYTMVGPVCWDQKCPASYPIQCGASCAVSHDACALSTESQVLTPLQVITNVVGMVVTGGGSAAAEVAAKSAGEAAVEAGISASLKAAAKSAGKTLADSAASSAASTFGSAEISGSFDFYSLDPTGVASVVEAYNKPVCSNVPQN